MSKQTKRIIIAIISFFVWPIGVILYFIYKPKRDAKLFGMLGLIGLILMVLGRISGIF